VLEIGCGSAELWRANVDRLDPTCSLTLTDLSPGMVEKAQAVLGERADYAVVDASEIPYDDDLFDVVIANHMLYHVPDELRPRAVRELARVLRPAGRLVAATNGLGHLAELRALAGDLMWSRVHDGRRFGLENGAAQLAVSFIEIERELFPNHLEVTEAEPLVAYLRSLSVASQPDEPWLAAIEARVAAEIAAHGHFRISGDSGLFRARRL
jgi:SAM-dependent methyltransferase